MVDAQWGEREAQVLAGASFALRRFDVSRRLPVPEARRTTITTSLLCACRSAECSGFN